MNILTLLIIGLIFVAAILLIVVKMRGKRDVIEQPVLAPPSAAYPPGPQQSSVQANTKRCPTCGNTYTDETLRYCLMDGASLEYAVGSTAPYDPGATIRFNDRGDDRLAPTIQYQPEMRDNKGKV
jgi:hypothetical protein